MSFATTASPVLPGCDETDRSVGNFDCIRSSGCRGVDRADQQLDIVEFLCATADAESAEPGTLQIADVLETLPIAFQRNFTLKHGTQEAGLRGHPQEIMADVVGRRLAMNSQSADLDFPRVFLWDERTGFTISYNGGLTAEEGQGRTQTGANRLDMLRYDATTSSFELWALRLPLVEDPSARNHAWQIAPEQPSSEDDNCTRCHGPRSRPIWPMYPDWPGFYGSDNDELTKGTEHQRVELSFLEHFRLCVAPGVVSDNERCRSAVQHAQGNNATVGDTGQVQLIDQQRRYGTLFANALDVYMAERFAALDRTAIRGYLTGLEERLAPGVLRRTRSEGAERAARGSDADLRAWLGLTTHRAFPYRPNHFDHSSEASRAFYHRPNLRLGVIYNRLTARNVFAALIQHDTYRRFKKLMAFALMDCGWDGNRTAQVATLNAFEVATRERLAALEMSLGNVEQENHRILYPVLLAAFDQKVRDVDIRYTYANRRYDAFDRSYRQANVTQNIMELGYLSYRGGDHNGTNGARHYFNSYFDGSATTNELLAALIVQELIAEQPEPYARLGSLHSLREKYERFVSRYALDAEFFTAMDALGPWIPTPYPRHIEELHHRGSFTQEFRENYQALCTQLATDLGTEFAVSQ